MSERRKIATCAVQISALCPIKIECVVKPSRGFPDNSTCTIVRVRSGTALSRHNPRAQFDGQAAGFKCHSSQLGFAAQRWRMSLRRSSVSSSSPSLLFPPVYPSSRYTETTGEEEVDGPLCPASPGDPSFFFRASSTSQSDTPPHSAHFSPPLCQCTTDVDGEQKRFARLRRWLMDESKKRIERKRERLVSILYLAWICSRAILSVITIARPR